MILDLNTYDSPSQAMELLDKKGVLPTALSSREAREQIAELIRQRSVFSARTTNATYVQALRDAVAKWLAGGKGGTFAELRRDLQKLLVRLEYDPETGFPGDDALGIPAAAPGSLRDLSSDRRIKLVLGTQIALHQNAALKARGLEPMAMYLYPAWELVRIESRKVPRGSEASASIGWQQRWLKADGPILESGRLAALKDDPVWAALGDSSLFDDALDVDTPPFVYGTGKGWRAVARDEAIALGLPVVEAERARKNGKDRTDGTDGKKTAKPGDFLPPAPVADTKHLDDPVKAALLAKIRAKRAAKPRYIQMREIVAGGLSGEARELYLRDNPID